MRKLSRRERACIACESYAATFSIAPVYPYIVAVGSLYATILHAFCLNPLFADQMAVLAHHNNFRSIHYRNPAYPARHDPTC